MRASRNGSIWQHVDWITIGLFLALVFFGWMNIYGASYTFDQTSIVDFSNRAGKQFAWIMGSLVLGGVLLLIDYKTYDVLAYIAYGAMLLLLLVTPFLAHDIKGSMSWISLGPVSLQPAEFAKCIVALAVAKYMGRYEYKLRGWRDLIIPFALIGVPALIIMVLQKMTTDEMHNYLTINRGKKDGIVRGQGVRNEEGVVGIVRTVGRNYSVVLPLINTNTNLSCRFTKNDYIGTLQWDGKDSRFALLEDVAAHMVVNPGDTIVTSGLSPVFPEGIPVGIVESVWLNRHNYSTRVSVPPYCSSYAQKCGYT